ncbi:hypothetical protein BO86DRAFT_380731 [Aspergillus japonicus CBS 114.51]|uniref:Uncharacterized protein n=1 Tax=Aspergillus japonicus CBS 114.51 TaxID=1448312 RepID=A0A8T8WX39_ASPJA|nr:hypothetical protein BO86DRAFT_380731 [Aspergillus japonicus CBS 114.51]RAH80190.1 hypothetical protein BO86DRAFT_380731 [Aspergillus japonicus CBS 114.51]
MGAASGTWSYLVFAGGTLMSNQKIKRHVQKIGEDTKPEEIEVPERRSIEVIPLPFQRDGSEGTSVFRGFQMLLLDTRDYFWTCLRSRRWESMGQGLYARSPERRAELKTLGCFHNMIADAISLSGQGNDHNAWALTSTASRSLESNVHSYHHRKVSDILGVLVMLKQAEQDSLCHRICQSIVNAQMDCRRMTAASFPRAENNGSYDLFRDMTPDNVFKILKDIDGGEQLGEFSHESICLWHTAIRWLKLEGDFAQMVEFGEYLSLRWHTFGPWFDLAQ